MHSVTLPLLLAALLPLQAARPQTLVPSQAKSPASFDPTSFDRIAEEALQAMRSQAEQSKISGVTVVAYMPGATLQSWTSEPDATQLRRIMQRNDTVYP